MTKITDASATQILLAEETQYGIMPKPLNGLEFGITGEGMSPNIATVESEELNLNPDLVDNVLSSVDAGGDLNFEVCEGAGMRKILEHAFRGSWAPVGSPAVNTLKSGAEDKSMTIVKKFSSSNGDFPFAYTGSRLNSLNFNITADGGIITATANFMSRNEDFCGNFGFFQKALAPAYSNFLGNVGDMLITNSGNVYIKDYTSWKQMSNPFTGAVLNIKTPALDSIASGTVIPSAPAVAGILYLNIRTGQWYLSALNGVLKYLPIAGMITLPDLEGVWRTGTDLPADSLGVYGDYYLVLGTIGTDVNAGKIFQKTSRESNAPWIQVANISGTAFTPSSAYYYNMSVIPKSFRTKMNIPQFKNVIVTGIGATGAYCFTDLGFTIENNCENVKGICTRNTVYPWLSSVETKYGSRKISGNASILFNSVEMYEDFFKKNKVMSISFSMENGEGQAWTFYFPKVKFTEGSINAESKGSNIVIPLKWVALYDESLGYAMMVEEASVAKLNPLTAPVLYGASEVTHEGFTLDYSYVETALGYQVQVASDELFENIIIDDDVADPTSISDVITGLDPDTEYFVRVRAYDSDEESEWSGTESVITIIETPSQNSDPVAVGDDNFVLTFNEVIGASSYRLDVSRFSNFSSFEAGYEDKEIDGSPTTVMTGEGAMMNYYVRVRAVSSHGYVTPDSGTKTVSAHGDLM